MEYLIIGFWENSEDGSPQTESLPTDHVEVEDAVKRIKKKACRTDDPACILVIDDRNGPKVAYNWKLGNEYGACRFTDPRGERQIPKELMEILRKPNGT